MSQKSALGEGLGQGSRINGPCELVHKTDSVPCSVILAFAVSWYSPWVCWKCSSVEEDSDLISCPSLVGFAVLYLPPGTGVRSPRWQEPSGPAAPGSCCPVRPSLPPPVCTALPPYVSASQGKTPRPAPQKFTLPGTALGPQEGEPLC